MQEKVAITRNNAACVECALYGIHILVGSTARALISKHFKNVIIWLFGHFSLVLIINWTRSPWQEKLLCS